MIISKQFQIDRISKLRFHNFFNRIKEGQLSPESLGSLILFFSLLSQVRYISKDRYFCGEYESAFGFVIYWMVLLLSSILSFSSGFGHGCRNAIFFLCIFIALYLNVLDTVYVARRPATYQCQL